MYVDFLKNQEINTTIKGMDALEKLSVEATSWMVWVSERLLQEMKVYFEMELKSQQDKEVKAKIEAQIERIIGQRHPDRLVFAPIHELAKELGVNSQTLHRRLKESATSYQKIKDNLRREVAIHKLVNERLSVEKVADIVGFSEPRSFTRAFKHWTGLTPREYCKREG